MADISVVGEGICTQLGEGPTWDTITQKLFFVDALDYSVHLLDVETGKVRLTKSNGTKTVKFNLFECTSSQVKAATTTALRNSKCDRKLQWLVVFMHKV